MTAQPTTGGQVDEHGEPRFWNGMIAFAAFILVLLGGFHVLAGLVALLEDDQYLVGESDLLVQADYRVWGFTHIALALVMMATGYALFFRRHWARVVAVALAYVSALTNLSFLSANPPWFTLMIAIDVLVIYAVCVHGGPDDGY